MKYNQEESEEYSIKKIDKIKIKKLEDLENSRERKYCNNVKNKRTK